jgi:hypothetical protein
LDAHSATAWRNARRSSLSMKLVSDINSPLLGPF